VIKTVAFISQEAMEVHAKPCANTAIISITRQDDKPAVIKDGFNLILRLQFDDEYEERLGEKIGSIPDLGDDGVILCHGRILPDANHAAAIIDFIENLSCDHLIVHCHAGVSRSAAVAKFVVGRYGAVLDQANDDTSGSNKRLLRLLNKVALKHDLVRGKFIPCGDSPRGDSLYSNDKFGIF